LGNRDSQVECHRELPVYLTTGKLDGSEAKIMAFRRADYCKYKDF